MSKCKESCDACQNDAAKNARMAKRPTIAVLLLRFTILPVLSACSGCWEEIHYQPVEVAAADAASAQPRKFVDPPAKDAPLTPTTVAMATSVREAAQAEEGATAEAGDSEIKDPQSAAVAEPDIELMPFSTDVVSDEAPLAADSVPMPSDLFGDADEAASPVSSPMPEAPPVEAPSPDVVEPFVAAEMIVPPITRKQRLDAWTVASGWSLAVAIHAKGLDAERYASFLADAEQAAEALQVGLPPLPTASGGESLTLAAAQSLRRAAAAELADPLRRLLDDRAGASAQLAIRSHLLLLAYSPQGADFAADARALRDAGRASGLPAELWQPLVGLVDDRADFVAVRRAVFDLHQRVATLLSK
jgi:hypothetical protein